MARLLTGAVCTAVERLVNCRSCSHWSDRQRPTSLLGATEGAHEGELGVGAVGGVAGGDDPAGGVEREVLAELAAAVEVGGEDAVAVEARCPGVPSGW